MSTAAASDDDGEALIEDDAKRDFSRTVGGEAPRRESEAAERAAEAAKEGKESTMTTGEYDRAVEAEIQQLKAKGQSSNAGLAGKDESAATPGAKNTAGVGVRVAGHG